MTKISATLRAAIFSGAVGLLPSIAFADNGSNDAGGSNGQETAGSVPDHAAAEAGSQGEETTRSGDETTVPDHATAERRGAEAQ